MGMSTSELLVILVIAILVFGTKRLRNVGSDLGEAIKNFRKAMKDDSSNESVTKSDDKVLEGEVLNKENDKEKV